METHGPHLTNVSLTEGSSLSKNQSFKLFWHNLYENQTKFRFSDISSLLRSFASDQNIDLLTQLDKAYKMASTSLEYFQQFWFCSQKHKS